MAFVDDVLNDFSTIEKKILKSELIKEAKSAILQRLDNVEISTEERDKLYAQYVEQLTLGVISQALNAALQIPVIEKDLEIKDKQKDEAAYKTLTALAALKKQYGYANATTSSLGTSTGDGLIDKQIKGFDKDAYHKLNADLAGVQQMLAQNDIEVPEWQVDTMRLLIEFLTDGKINVKKTDDGTTVEYKPDATSPNGLEE